MRATDRLYRTTDQLFSVVECKSCALRRLDPRPAPAELARYYPESYWFAPENGLLASLQQAYRRFVIGDHVAFACRALRPGRNDGILVDVGCGGGLFLSMMARRGFQVLGLDNSYGAAEVARRTHGITVLQGELPACPIRHGSCSGVTLFHVVEHLADPIPHLEAAYALLSPNGRLIVQVPNAASWQSSLFGANWNGLDVPRHLIDYRCADLEELLRRCGFEILRRKFFSLRDNPAGFATSIAPSLDPMARLVRGVRDSTLSKTAKDLAYFSLVAAAAPFTLLEAACGAGSTVMLEARKRS